MAKFTDQGLKDRIIEKLKSEGLTVMQAEAEFGIPKNTIYGWLRKKSVGDPSVLEIAKLRRENKELKEIIGTLALDSERRKKNS
jgi:transposase-like protein